LEINLGRLTELYTRPKALFEQLLTPLPISTENIYLIAQIKKHGLALKYGFLSYSIIMSWLGAITFLHAIAAFSAVKKRLLHSSFSFAFNSLFVLTFLIIFVHGLAIFETHGRFWSMNLWLVYILSALGIAYWLEKMYGGPLQKKPWIKWLFVFIVSCYVMTVLFDFGQRNSFERAAVIWLKNHKIETKDVYFSTRRLSVRASVFNAEIGEVNDAISKNVPYLVLKTSEANDKKLSLDGYKLIESFPDPEHAEVKIYKGKNLD
jgi:4-amino-4-deoxy-L-arabinose transferase-like glycosyltransferase